MAKVTRDTALRSIEDLLRALPANAAIDLTKVGTPPPRGTAVVVKIEVAAAEIGKRPGMSKANLPAIDPTGRQAGPRDSGVPDFRGLKSGRSDKRPKENTRGKSGEEGGGKGKEADDGQGPGGGDPPANRRAF